MLDQHIFPLFETSSADTQDSKEAAAKMLKWIITVCDIFPPPSNSHQRNRKGICSTSSSTSWAPLQHT